MAIEEIVKLKEQLGEKKFNEHVVDELIKLQGSMGWEILLAQIECDKLAAIEELLVADPSDTKQIISLQARATRFDYYADTISELITSAVGDEVLEDAETGLMVEDDADNESNDEETELNDA